MVKRASWFTAVPVLLLLAATALAKVHRTEAGAVYVPDDLAADAKVPVLVVEGGLADGQAKLWEAVSAKRQVILVETVSLRAALRDPAGGGVVGRAIDQALAAADKVHDIDPHPWILVGFSRAAPFMTNVALRRPGRFQGLLLANSGTQPGHIQVDMAPSKGFPVAIVHGTKDAVFKHDRAAKMAEYLNDEGLAATFTSLETDDHIAPLGPGGMDALVALLALAEKRDIPDRAAPLPFETIDTENGDGPRLTADLYRAVKADAPVVILCHQARSSRGEYRSIAARLAQAGYHCIAIDQRAGAQWAGVLNETAARATSRAGYLDAQPDLVRAIEWARELGFTGKIALWGSSYSASLAIVVGSSSTKLDAVVAFSPGEYFDVKTTVRQAARNLSKPLLIIAPPREEEQVREIYDAVSITAKDLYIQPEGAHGSRTLYRSATSQAAWQKVLGFLGEYLK